jgi:PAS domain S-box-containing protein
VKRSPWAQDDEDSARVREDIATRLSDPTFLFSIVDAVADPIFVKDEQHRWIALNLAMGEMFGVERESLLGRSDFDFFPEEEAQVFWEKDQLVFDGGEVNVNEEDFTDADGVTHHISTKKQRFVDAHGRPFLVGVIRDVTEQKKSERALLEAKEAAESAARAKAAFLANVSHELRTPLNAVLGMTALLADTELDEEQREYARIIRQSGDDLLTLINDLLDLVKADEDRIELEELVFEVSACVERSVALVAPRAREKGLSLQLHTTPRVPAAVVGDITRVRQVLVNLLSNAVKFTDSGAVEVRVDASPRDGVDGEVELAFEVRDTGIGIPADRLDRLFVPFSQVDRSTTRRFGGTGLGLAISRRLARRMGGDIDVESVEGEGSTFRFTLGARPAALPHKGEEPLGSGLEPLGGSHPLRLLVAEDNHVNQKVARLMLRKLGYEADVAASGEEVIEALQRQRYDVVLMDVQMPGMDGLEATRRLRAQLPTERQPFVVALTASALPSDVERCRQAGMDAHLAKPVHPAELRATLAGAPRLREPS